MPHQVFVGVAQEVVALGAIGAQIETFEDGDQLGEPILHLLARPELAVVVEVRLVDDPLQVVRLGEPADDLVDPVADLLVALEPRHVGEAAAIGHFDQRIRPAGVLVGDVLHEQQGQDVVLVLRGVDFFRATCRFSHDAPSEPDDILAPGRLSGRLAPLRAELPSGRVDRAARRIMSASAASTILPSCVSSVPAILPETRSAGGNYRDRASIGPPERRNDGEIAWRRGAPVRWWEWLVATATIDVGQVE